MLSPMVAAKEKEWSALSISCNKPLRSTFVKSLELSDENVPIQRILKLIIAFKENGTVFQQLRRINGATELTETEWWKEKCDTSSQTKINVAVLLSDSVRYISFFPMHLVNGKGENLSAPNAFPRTPVNQSNSGGMLSWAKSSNYDPGFSILNANSS